MAEGTLLSHPTTPHVSVASTSCARSWERGRINVNIPTDPTTPHVSVASTSCARSRERCRGNVNIPTPPHVIVASSSYARSRERGRINVNIPTDPTTPHVSVASTSCARSRECCRGNVNIPTCTLLHVSVASRSCAWSREHGRGNVNIPTPLYSTPRHPIPCKLRGKWWALRVNIPYMQHMGYNKSTCWLFWFKDIQGSVITWLAKGTCCRTRGSLGSRRLRMAFFFFKCGVWTWGIAPQKAIQIHLDRDSDDAPFCTFWDKPSLFAFTLIQCEWSRLIRIIISRSIHSQMFRCFCVWIENLDIGLNIIENINNWLVVSMGRIIPYIMEHKNSCLKPPTRQHQRPNGFTDSELKPKSDWSSTLASWTSTNRRYIYIYISKFIYYPF